MLNCIFSPLIFLEQFENSFADFRQMVMSVISVFNPKCFELPAAKEKFCCKHT